ncbi:hypothetical protein KR074_001707 [Drosophila pseudoananassae]|nr:hypothetical protein KR074_001707 [Drosophila pseudoananassae]
MLNPWHGRKHAKILQIKKRVAKCKNKFRKNQEVLMELHIRNRIKKFIIDDLKRKLGMSEE